MSPLIESFLIYTENFNQKPFLICKHYLSDDMACQDHEVVFVIQIGQYFKVSHSLQDLFCQDAKALMFENDTELFYYLRGRANYETVDRNVQVDSVEVKAWDLYDDETQALTHKIEINDQRLKNGQFYMSFGAVEGKVDDCLSLVLEVNQPPGINSKVECLHLYFEDDVAVSLFKVADKYVLRPENGVKILPSMLENKQLVYEITAS